MVVFQLHIRRVNQLDCVFELSWGKGQRLSATLAYPDALIALYTQWQQTYLNYYQLAFRGQVKASGVITCSPDWHAKLVQAEAKLLSEFHHWLRSAELFEIRAAITQGYLLRENELEQVTPACKQHIVNIFLTCHTIDLDRLPWEAWEINGEFPEMGSIRLIRTPVNIHHPISKPAYKRRRKARVLVILGDDTGLNLQADCEAIRQISRLATIEFIGWQPGRDINELKAEVSIAIASEQGWDVLFFAGHSNEMAITGGELAIAPNTSISIREIAPQIQLAKARGLKFALFNSCLGLNLATSLIDLGLSQVAIMREPIHNTVAQVFLGKFMQALAAHKDVQESLLEACYSLKVEKNLTYPSAYLIPSLFCHPEAVPYRIPLNGVKERVKRLLPKPIEAIALSSLIFLSLSLPVQDWLLTQRLHTQAIFRQITQQLPTSTLPPVLLVQIDEESIQKARIANPKPINRSYLARLVTQLANRQAKVVGVDYILARPQGEDDQLLRKTLETSVQKPPITKFVFAAAQDNTGKWLKVSPEVASQNWSLVGNIRFVSWYMSLVPRSNSPSQKLPFSYILSLVHQLQINPQINSQTDFFSQITNYIRQEQGVNYKNFFSPTSQLQPITKFSYKLGQMWMHPIIDFSIPPQQVYESIPAWKLLEKETKLPHLPEQIVIIVPGGYGEAGVFQEGRDNFTLPMAIGYWFNQASPPVNQRSLTGGEVHAYMIHHFLNRRLVVPIPDLWLIGVAALLGKLTAKTWEFRSSKRRQQWILVLAGITIYGLVSLQVYVSAAILLPWVLPTLTFWSYALPVLLKKKLYR